MSGKTVSRRLFLKGTGTLAGSSAFRLSMPGLLALSEAVCTARDAQAAFDVLSDGEARALDAIAARILPTTDTPGARDAGVIYFMDKALGSFMSDELESIRAGLSEFESGLAASFAELAEADQDAYLSTQDRSHFFNRVRFMTLAGFLGMTSHGGNRDQVGWKLLGFDGHRGAWQPPFGYYDAEYMREQQDDD